jgi:hypothetical protein
MIAFCEEITSEFSELVVINILISWHKNKRGKLQIEQTRVVLDISSC